MALGVAPLKGSLGSLNAVTDSVMTLDKGVGTVSLQVETSAAAWVDVEDSSGNTSYTADIARIGEGALSPKTAMAAAIVTNGDARFHYRREWRWHQVARAAIVGNVDEDVGQSVVGNDPTCCQQQECFTIKSDGREMVE